MRITSSFVIWSFWFFPLYRLILHVLLGLFYSSIFSSIFFRFNFYSECCVFPKLLDEVVPTHGELLYFVCWPSFSFEFSNFYFLPQPAECHVCMEPEWTQTEIKVRFLCPEDIDDVKALGQECFPIE